MSDPVRLFDEAPSELTSALRAEREFSNVFHEAVLKERVLTHIAAGAVPSALSVTALTWTSTAWPMLLAGVVGVGVGVGATLASVHPPKDVAPVVVSAVATPVKESPVAIRTAELAPPLEQPPLIAVPPTDRAIPRIDKTIAITSSLVDETRRYERAEAALRDKKASVAIDELRGYLDAYPRGTLRNEVRLTLLEALFADGRFIEARDLAKGLIDERELRDRRAEIVHVLVRSRVQLGECNDAAADVVKVPEAAPALKRVLAECPAAAGRQ